MEKGKLIIKTGKSGLFANIQIDGGKLLTSLGGFIPNKTHETLNGKDIEFERVNGGIVKIICEGNVIFDKASQQSSSNERPKQNQNQSNHYNQNRSDNQQRSYSQTTSYTNKSTTNKARAPYNFVPLNETIVPVDDRLEDRSKFHSNGKTGYIELTITNKTPIYVRDSFSNDELKKMKDAEGKSERYISSDFFSPTGKAAIPGSSLRGMIRTIVEILSYSKFGFTQNNRRLYFRTFADSVRGVRDEYQRYMSAEKGQEKKMKAGILHKRSYQSYELIPAGKVTKVFGDDAKRLREKGEEIHRGVYKISKDEFIVSIKNLEGKFNNYHVKKDPTQKPIPLDYELDILTYKDDTRGTGIPNLVELCNKKEQKTNKPIEFVPCFYTFYSDKERETSEDIEENTNKDKKASKTLRCAFGHNPYFRLPYFKTINDHIIQNDKGEKEFAISIFGFVDSDYSKNKTQIAGRVFFTDAVMEKGDLEKNEIAPKILSSPKPTTFQHYLEQNGKGDSDSLRDMYNHPTKIRGNKLYWNFNPKENWKEKDQEKVLSEIRSGKDTQHTKLKSTKPGSTFKGKIYFENLTEKELGALLCALDLQPDSYHKIGMGKSYGLGSIKIESKVFVSKPENRYASLDTEWIEEWKPLPDSEKYSYKESFSNYLLSKLSPKEKGMAETLWELPRIKELVKMLQFYENENLIQKFTYMEIQKFNSQTGKKENEFKGRPILPKPTQIT